MRRAPRTTRHHTDTSVRFLSRPAPRPRGGGAARARGPGRREYALACRSVRMVSRTDASALDAVDAFEPLSNHSCSFWTWQCGHSCAAFGGAPAPAPAHVERTGASTRGRRRSREVPSPATYVGVAEGARIGAAPAESASPGSSASSSTRYHRRAETHEHSTHAPPTIWPPGGRGAFGCTGFRHRPRNAPRRLATPRRAPTFPTRAPCGRPSRATWARARRWRPRASGYATPGDTFSRTSLLSSSPSSDGVRPSFYVLPKTPPPRRAGERRSVLPPVRESRVPVVFSTRVLGRAARETTGDRPVTEHVCSERAGWDPRDPRLCPPPPTAPRRALLVRAGRGRHLGGLREQTPRRPVQRRARQRRDAPRDEAREPRRLFQERSMLRARRSPGPSARPARSRTNLDVDGVKAEPRRSSVGNVSFFVRGRSWTDERVVYVVFVGARTRHARRRRRLAAIVAGACGVRWRRSKRKRASRAPPARDGRVTRLLKRHQARQHHRGGAVRRWRAYSARSTELRGRFREVESLSHRLENTAPGSIAPNDPASARVPHRSRCSSFARVSDVRSTPGRWHSFANTTFASLDAAYEPCSQVRRNARASGAMAAVPR